MGQNIQSVPHSNRALCVPPIQHTHKKRGATDTTFIRDFFSPAMPRHLIADRKKRLLKCIQDKKEDPKPTRGTFDFDQQLTRTRVTDIRMDRNEAI